MHVCVCVCVCLSVCLCVLQEVKAAEEKKNEKLAGSLEDLQSKNHKLMSALMVQSGQVIAKLN
jgi:cell division protein FtsB